MFGAAAAAAAAAAALGSGALRHPSPLQVLLAGTEHQLWLTPARTARCSIPSASDIRTQPADGDRALQGDTGAIRPGCRQHPLLAASPITPQSSIAAPARTSWPPAAAANEVATFIHATASQQQVFMALIICMGVAAAASARQLRNPVPLPPLQRIFIHIYILTNIVTNSSHGHSTTTGLPALWMPLSAVLTTPKGIGKNISQARRTAIMVTVPR